MTLSVTPSAQLSLQTRRRCSLCRRSLPFLQTLDSFGAAPFDFVKKLQPKLKEIRRVYSSPEFSKKVLEKWHPRATIRIDLSAIRNAIVSEVEEEDEDSNATVVFERGKRGRRLSLKEFWGEWVREAEGEGSGGGDWEPIRALKSRFKDFEKCSSSSEIFDGFKNSEFLEKVKSSLAMPQPRMTFYLRRLLPCVTEHLLAEIVQLTVTDITKAIEWLQCSYLYVRMKKNPENYSIKKGISGDRLVKHVQDICVKKVNELSQHQMVEIDEDGFLLSPLDPGRLMTVLFEI
ncbi:Digalactosyldiacylglycerol synthase 1 [Arachis hypogaea]|nr:Digalactosyldiacylglycerol synthase 1 [Arachis hypogaea]